MTETSTMAAAPRALLGGVFDYAGLFPPAALPMREAAANYARCRASQHAWALGRFVVPVSRFGEFDSAAAEIDRGGDVWPLAIIGSPIPSDGPRGEIRDLIRADCEAMGDLDRRGSGALSLDSCDWRWPSREDDARGVECVEAMFDAIELGRQCLGERSPVFFIEHSPRPDWRGAMPAFIERLARRGTAGLKLRCGGVSAGDDPESEWLAAAIHEAGMRGVKLKLTAGLHHPIRHFNAAAGFMMHGFLNMLVAIALSGEEAVCAEVLREVIEDEDAASFGFGEGQITWKDRAIELEAIEETRRRRLGSIGTCSFTEPIDDLKSLGWMS